MVVVEQKPVKWFPNTNYMLTNIPSQSEIDTYVERYKDETITFDACIYYAAFSSGSTSMLDILISGGDYVKNKTNGALFKVTVSKYDPVVRDAIPVAEGDNVFASLTVRRAGNNIILCDLVLLRKR